MIWFTADAHLGHTNILKLCNRPFSNTEEMNSVIIQKWNAVVKPEDTIYVVGDFAYKNNAPIGKFCTVLNGHKHLILGNHDRLSTEQYKKFFESVQDVKYIKIKEQDIVLFHYPILSWRRRGRGSWHLYGHVHTAVLNVMESQKSYNVGVDTNDFQPISFDKLQEIMDKKIAKASDQMDRWHEPKAGTS